MKEPGDNDHADCGEEYGGSTPPMATVDRGRGGPIRTGSKRRGNHTLHYYLAVAGLAAACWVCVLTIWAYYDEGHLLTKVAFIAAALTAALLFATWFWGTYLAMSGAIPTRRLAVLLIHAAFGSAAPLIYTVYIGFELTSLTSQPVGGSEVTLSVLEIAVLAGQFVMGRLLIHR